MPGQRHSQWYSIKPTVGRRAYVFAAPSGTLSAVYILHKILIIKECSPNFSMLGQCRRWWSSIKPTLVFTIGSLKALHFIFDN